MGLPPSDDGLRLRQIATTATALRAVDDVLTTHMRLGLNGPPTDIDDGHAVDGDSHGDSHELGSDKR